MNIAAIAKAPRVLLVNADNTVRGTVASVCRDLNVARVTQATSVAMAEQHLKTGRLSGLVLSMGEEAAALAMMTRLRAGDFPCGPDVAVVVMAHECSPDLARQLKALKVRRLLLQPFKLRDVIQTLEQLWEEGEGQKGHPGVAAKAPQSTAPPSDVESLAAVDAVESAMPTEPIEPTEPEETLASGGLEERPDEAVASDSEA